MAIRPGKCLLPRVLLEEGVTPQELSHLTGISIQQISDYCHGRRKMSLGNAITISFALGRPVEDLYIWNEIDRERKRLKRSSE